MNTKIIYFPYSFDGLYNRELIALTNKQIDKMICDGFEIKASSLIINDKAGDLEYEPFNHNVIILQRKDN